MTVLMVQRGKVVVGGLTCNTGQRSPDKIKAVMLLWCAALTISRNALSVLEADTKGQCTFMKCDMQSLTVYSLIQSLCQRHQNKSCTFTALDN